jgi:hypothetical protein
VVGKHLFWLILCHRGKGCHYPGELFPRQGRFLPHPTLASFLICLVLFSGHGSGLEAGLANGTGDRFKCGVVKGAPKGQIWFGEWTCLVRLRSNSWIIEVEDLLAGFRLPEKATH